VRRPVRSSFTRFSTPQYLGIDPAHVWSRYYQTFSHRSRSPHAARPGSAATNERQPARHAAGARLRRRTGETPRPKATPRSPRATRAELLSSPGQRTRRPIDPTARAALASRAEEMDHGRPSGSFSVTFLLRADSIGGGVHWINTLRSHQNRKFILLLSTVLTRVSDALHLQDLWSHARRTDLWVLYEWIHKLTALECTRWGLAFELSEFVHKCKPIQGTNTDAQIFSHKQANSAFLCVPSVGCFVSLRKMTKQTSNCYERQCTNRVENRTNFTKCYTL